MKLQHPDEALIPIPLSNGRVIHCDRCDEGLAEVEFVFQLPIEPFEILRAAICLDCALRFRDWDIMMDLMWKDYHEHLREIDRLTREIDEQNKGEADD